MTPDELVVFLLYSSRVQAIDDLGFSEITDFDVIFLVEQDVLRLQVSVSDVLLMHELKRQHDFSNDELARFIR